jgi:hypothetical protein
MGIEKRADPSGRVFDPRNDGGTNRRREKDKKRWDEQKMGTGGCIHISKLPTTIIELLFCFYKGWILGYTPIVYNAPMNGPNKPPSLFKRSLALFGWTRSSSVLLGGFFLLCGLIVYVWWPLAQEAMATINWKGPWWLEMDWLLVGIFAFMSLTIMAQANLQRDALIVFVGMVGGLVIEAWGTQTNLWHYYTAERPPLWIIPAWPIASLSIDRITRGMNWGVKRFLNTIPRKSTAGQAVTKEHEGKTLDPSGTSDTLETFVFKILYWLIFIAFFALMLYFVAPTFGKSFTIMALLLVALLTLTPTDTRYAVLTFLSGAGLGYFLELWGTTRQCWTYYTLQTPPFFAVVAHGMAAVAFWRAGLMVKWMWGKLAGPVIKRLRKAPNPEVGG